MKVLVYGGTKFVGMMVVNELLKLSEIESVTTASRKVSRYKNKKLTNLLGEAYSSVMTDRVLSGGPYDVCVLMNCMNEEEAEIYYKNVLPHIKRTIFISSVGVYSNQEMIMGNTKEQDINYESSSLVGLQAQYQMKLLAERVFAQNPNSRILRPSIILGPNDWTNRLQFYTRFFRNNKTLTRKSKENVKFHWIWSDHLAYTIVLIIKNWNSYKYKTYNIALDQDFFFDDFLTSISKILKKPVPPIEIEPNKEGYLDPLGKANCFVNIDRFKAEFPELARFSWNRYRNEIILANKDQYES